MTEPQFHPKEYEIYSLIITPLSGQEIDIRNLILEMNIHEDLFNNTTYGDLVVFDASNQIANLPIFGFETLLIDFGTPGKKRFRKTFRIYKITQRQKAKEKAQVYILHFTSQEILTSSNTKVSKSYKGKLISDIVEDIHKNYLISGQNLYKETTKFLHHIIIPNWAPFKAINWLAGRANSSIYQGANYVYFEDNKGFVFSSIENLIQNFNSGISFIDQPMNIRLPYEGDSEHKERDYDSDLVTMENYNIVNQIDALQNIVAGMYGNRIITHDILQKTWKKYDFNYQTSWNDYIHVEPNKVNNPNTKKPGKSFLLPQESGLDSSISVVKLFPSSPAEEYPNQVQEWLGKRISQLQQIQNIKVNLTVPGNTDITVGRTARFNIYSPEPSQESRQPIEPYYSGNYLITSVRHSLADHKYMTIVELTKDSVYSALP